MDSDLDMTFGKVYKLEGRTPVEATTEEEIHRVFSMEGQAQRIVDKGWVNDFYVITEFTGVDQSSNGKADPPLLFHTLICHTILDVDYVPEAYATWEEAERGFNKCFSKMASLTNTNLNLNQMKMLFNDF